MIIAEPSDSTGPDRPRVALIAGPTASGKSALALALAEREDGVIINADASQVYRDLRILTARPDAADEARVPHRLYGYIDAAEACSAARWAEDARKTIAEVVAQQRLPILVGGTGLYFRTLIAGIAPVPAIDLDIRAAVRGQDRETSYAALQREDAAMASILHPNDSARVQRALEVIRSTGVSVSQWRAVRTGGIVAAYRFEPHFTAMPVAENILRCDERVRAMFADGVVDEVDRLAERSLPDTLPAMRAIGVAQIIALKKGRISKEEAIADIQRATRRYGKRQRTWFRHQSIV